MTGHESRTENDQIIELFPVGKSPPKRSLNSFHALTEIRLAAAQPDCSVCVSAEVFANARTLTYFRRMLSMSQDFRAYLKFSIERAPPLVRNTAAEGSNVWRGGIGKLAKANAAVLLAGLGKEKPKKLVSVIRFLWPEIRNALACGHTLKEVHARLGQGGVEIKYRVLAAYVGRFRREDRSSDHIAAPHTGFEQTSLTSTVPISKPIGETVISQVPSRRLLNCRAAARYLGLNAQTLRRITDCGELPARMLSKRRAYVLEDLDAFVDALPRFVKRR